MMQDASTMRSPVTGGRVTLCWEWRDMEFRKEKFRVMFPYYKCEDTGEQFTTTESDGVWYAQLHNQYCKKYGIPYNDEIVSVRERYGLSAAKMSLILGFGPNMWRKYEQEEVPNVSNGRMIRSIMNPEVFMGYLEGSRAMLSEHEYCKIYGRIKQMASASADSEFERYQTRLVFALGRGPENGFGALSLCKLKNVMLYVLEHCTDVWFTKMNKLLFYIDFLSYRERGMSMTGLGYRAISFGPVPEHWERVYSQFDEISQEPRVAGDFEGIILKAGAKSDASVFETDERLILQRVCDKLGRLSSSELTELSHQEQAWLSNCSSHSIIPYSDAFALKGI